MLINILLIIWHLNLLAAIVTVFREKREISATWAWLLVLVVLPVFGFILYAFAGRKMSSEEIFEIKKQEKLTLEAAIARQKDEWDARELTNDTDITASGRGLVHFFLESNGSVLTKNNHVTIFTDGEEKFATLFEDIRQAQETINVEYYSFYSDNLGLQLLKELTNAQKRGVKVRILYDLFGSHGTNYKTFKEFEKVGGQAQAFVSTPKSRRWTSVPRLNYHDHRKLVIIDGKLGYIGGFNVADQYISRNEKFGYWRDTHLRIIGESVAAMQLRFAMDWNTSCRRTRKEKLPFTEEYFKFDKIPSEGDTAIQIVSSGPDNEHVSIKRGYQKLISSAEDYLYIQSPYLIPDAAVLEALVIAAQSGVDVRIMIPCMPDHAFVYRATEYYAHYLLENGVRIYRYDKGFLHAKTMVSDDHISSVGSANMDYRSFFLNFEVNAFMYNDHKAKQLKKIFEADIEEATELDLAYFQSQSLWRKFKQDFSRLLSATL
ncbi:cardiolipin synthase [Ligilactobacillus equi]|uniref:Cardiolipin synthase n=1 Tax=Ligilactobacillus equi DPC 6820 TaxID=1392007 RepID=V7HW90_9LACO|nr:cardiolipin synthase [Ligilactobacillus equi]ETA73463.1 cardiolipin synthetase [Ligilactobacillus equi DPC 6820]